MFLFKMVAIFIVIIAVLLIGVILLQEPKERLIPSGGGPAPTQRIGIHQKADFLEKATWVLVGVLLFFTFFSSIFLKKALQPAASTISKPDREEKEQEIVKGSDSDNNNTKESAIGDQTEKK